MISRRNKKSSKGEEEYEEDGDGDGAEEDEDVSAESMYYWSSFCVCVFVCCLRFVYITKCRVFVVVGIVDAFIDIS